MPKLVVVKSYPKGRRVWIAGQRVHHGATGALLCALALRRRRALAALGLLLVAHDIHDWREWFARERVPIDPDPDSEGSYPPS